MNRLVFGRSVVVMEGDPNPGAIKGRMSFKGFNPLIDVSISFMDPYISIHY